MALEVLELCAASMCSSSGQTWDFLLWPKVLNIWNTGIFCGLKEEAHIIG